MDLHIYPMLFKPILKTDFGVEKELYDFLEIEKPQTDDPLGECWFISDRELDQTEIANGPYEGMELSELVKEYPAKFVGNKHRSSDRFLFL